ncbi:trigger factor [Alcaligenaceae bacterium LF4-65]|jgi:trigger factor|uniref:Trigger factor n=1 Tax=Zwartia hollandica TaxID=324606 RepID=A0A953N828_9BURK|nr:trigger factor [Zwartia hollandica]MBZ1349332.1 trigger factor [Zwartia hollandica]
MQPVVETLSGLERRLELSVLLADVETAVQAELKRAARTAKAPGFRPGKVPMAMLERTHAPGIRYDAINDKVGQAFEKAIEAAGLRIAGAPKLEPKTEGTPEGTLAFFATFEVYPAVTVPDLSGLKIKRAVTTVGEAEVQRTVDILRKQRAEYAARDGRAAQDDDRVTLDFAGTIDGVPFEGGKADAFPFVLGQGRMLPEFEAAARGMKAGESKVFPLAFPADYGGKDVAGKTAEFTINVKEVAEPVLPVIDAEFAKSLGQPEGDVEKLLADIRGNIEREVKARTLARTKTSVMDALIGAVSFDVPKALVDSECQSRVQAARAELTQRGVPNADKMPIPADAFTAEAERRVRLGLLVSELVQQAQLQAKPEQVRARIEEFAGNYEKPAEVVSYYLSDRARRAEVEGIVLEDNVVQHALAKAQVEDEQVPFDQIMGTA